MSTCSSLLISCIELLSEIVGSRGESRVPYTYHHDYLRANVPALSDCSRAEIANKKTYKNQDELYCACVCQILSGMDFRQLSRLMTSQKRRDILKIIYCCDIYIERLKAELIGTNPEGYIVLARYRDLNPNEIAVGVYFSRMSQTCPELFYHEGNIYKRGEIGYLSGTLSSELCSVRIYSLLEPIK